LLVGAPSRDDDSLAQRDGGLKDVTPEALIAPADQSPYRPFRPVARTDLCGRGEVQIETHYGLPPGEIQRPGLTHHMLYIRLHANVQLYFNADGEKFEGVSRAGHLTLLPAACPSHLRWQGNCTEMVQLYFSPAYFGQIVEQEWNIDPGALEIPGNACFCNDAIMGLARLLRDGTNNTAPGGRLLLESLSSAAAVLLLRSQSSVAARIAPVAPRGGLGRKALNRVTDYIRDHLAEDIGLIELSSLAGCSPQHFKRAFKRSIGLPPHRFLMARRVERAQALLARRDLSIAEVALSCGFATQSHLTSVFRQKTGSTPGQWRRAAAEPFQAD
jgi:AraC family transcriptional regulator